MRLLLVEVYTDPLKQPNLGYDFAPFTGFATFSITEDMPDVGLVEGQRFSVFHTATTTSHPGMQEGGPWQIDTQHEAPGTTSLDAYALSSDSTYRLASASGVVEGAWSGCEVDLLFSTPEEFLQSLIDG